jgi:succinyl-CoA synthetase alpha subunit
MFRNSVGPFKYFTGVRSLAEIATREDRVCVLNILGGESSDVTPVGHAWSGGNVVFGTSPGRRGQVLETPAGNIPVYNNVREGLEAGHRFNCGVVYLPPSAADDGVVELIRVNPELTKIFIPTEKMSVHDAREIRAMAQARGIDIFGGNSLGVADSWNQVRIGGALGGDKPGDTLRKGSVAILSNSGGFTTTIAQYLRMGGWGTTTLVSSGKDVYIHYAAPEFAFAFGNDARSQAATTSWTPSSPSRSWPAWSAAGRASSPARSAMPAPCPVAATTPSPRNAGSWTSSAWTPCSRPSGRCARHWARWSPTSRTSRPP